MKTILFLITLTCLFVTSAFSQIPTQTVRGKISDSETSFPLVGAKVMIITGKPEEAQKYRALTNDNGDFEITTNTYIFAGVGGVILAGLAAAALGGMQNIVAAGVVGALAGGCLGLFF